MIITNFNKYNENILNKAKELINYKEIKENDKVAKKYVDMILNDYKSKKNLLKVKIAINKYGTNLWYKIDNTPYNAPDESNGSEYTLIEIMYIKENWSDDISGGRINASILKRSGRFSKEKELFGRDWETNELVTSDDGVNSNTLTSYINISGKIAKNIINFFTKEYRNIYPQLSTDRYLNKRRILEVDKELSKKIDHHYKMEKYEQEKKYINEKNLIINKIESLQKYPVEEIEDIFISESEENKIKVLPVIYHNGKICYIIKSNNFTGVQNYQNNTDVKFEENTMYYLIGVKSPNFEIPSRIKRIFNVIDISNKEDEDEMYGEGRPEPSIVSEFFSGYDYAIVIKQK